MESFPSRRRLSRKAVTCLVAVCLMFVACAFFSFDFESYDSALPYKSVDGNWNVPRGTSVPFQHQNELSTSKPGPERQSKLPHSPSTQPISPVHSALRRSESAKTRYVMVNTSHTTVAPSSSSSPHPTDTCNGFMKDSKLILLWTSFFDHWDYFSESSIQQCSRCRNCRVTKDRSKLLESDAVIFHARDMSLADMPPVRLPHQRWVFYCLESPPYSDFPGLSYTEGMFNWTMTYRSDSDVRAMYGRVHKVRPPRKENLEYLEWSWSNKTKSVAWMTSHCPTHGGRDSYVQELKRYIDVDIYGQCGSFDCPRGETDRCLQQFADKYKFFLAFENSLCKDYVTEKFFRTLKYDIVPVVFGGANYSRFAPPGSYVEALSFKSPKHLAFFLAGVGRNFKMYSSYFKWRENYAVEFSNKKECQLCSLLHRSDLVPASYPNLRDWWVRNGHCRVWKPKR